MRGVPSSEIDLNPPPALLQDLYRLTARVPRVTMSPTETPNGTAMYDEERY
jgi:hypothetical protein